MLVNVKLLWIMIFLGEIFFSKVCIKLIILKMYIWNDIVKVFGKIGNVENWYVLLGILFFILVYLFFM